MHRPKTTTLASLEFAFSNDIRRNIIEMSIDITNVPTLHVFVGELRLNLPPPTISVKTLALPILPNCTIYCGMCHISVQHIVVCVI